MSASSKARGILEKTLIYLVPFLIFMSVLNALFNHAGVTPLFICQTATP